MNMHEAGNAFRIVTDEEIKAAKVIAVAFGYRRIGSNGRFANLCNGRARVTASGDQAETKLAELRAQYPRFEFRVTFRRVQ